MTDEARVKLLQSVARDEKMVRALYNSMKAVLNAAAFNYPKGQQDDAINCRTALVITMGEFQK